MTPLCVNVATAYVSDGVASGSTLPAVLVAISTTNPVPDPADVVA